MNKKQLLQIMAQGSAYYGQVLMELIEKVYAEEPAEKPEDEATKK